MPAVTFTDPPVKVLKFGGTSVGDLDGLKRVLSIIRGELVAYRAIVVVSATAGTTDTLVHLARVEPAERGALVDGIRDRHEALARDLLGDSAHAAYLRLLRERLDDLRAVLAEPDAPARTASILATGERLSAPLVALGLERLGLEATAVDAVNLISTDSDFGAATVDLAATRRTVEAWFAILPPNVVPVVTGFIGRSSCGRTTVLGRGGSDYTASLLAEAVSATKLDRWTDVDGLHTADPRRFDGTGRFLYLLLEDASTWNETSRLGMHPQAFEPVRRACIPVHVRSTRHPQGDGTLILPRRLAGHVRTHSRNAMKRAAHRERGSEAQSDR
jgi:aspartate kinase